MAAGISEDVGAPTGAHVFQATPDWMGASSPALPAGFVANQGVMNLPGYSWTPQNLTIDIPSIGEGPQLLSVDGYNPAEAADRWINTERLGIDLNSPAGSITRDKYGDDIKWSGDKLIGIRAGKTEDVYKSLGLTPSESISATPLSGGKNEKVSEVEILERMEATRNKQTNNQMLMLGLTTAASLIAQIWQSRETRKYNEEMYEKQRADTKEDLLWRRDVLYGSTGGGGGGSATSAPTLVPLKY